MVLYQKFLSNFHVYRAGEQKLTLGISKMPKNDIYTVIMFAN